MNELSEQLHMLCMFKAIFFQVFRKMKRLYLRFLIFFIFVAIVFFDTFVFRYTHRKINNLEMVN